MAKMLLNAPNRFCKVEIAQKVFELSKWLKIKNKFFLMTFPFDSHTPTDVKPDMIPGV